MESMGFRVNKIGGSSSPYNKGRDAYRILSSSTYPRGSRRKGLVWHWGIWLPEGVLHNTPDKDEHISSIIEFADGQNIEVFHPHFLNRQEIINRAYEIATDPSAYQYLWRNCEHTVTKIIEGKPNSPTINNLAILTLVISCTYLVIRYRKVG